MCHTTKYSTQPLSTTRVCQSYNYPVVTIPQESVSSESTKSRFRLNPFRRVAKTARINLNRYWGLLSKLNLNNGEKSATSDETAFAAEMEQNRINELLESQHALASSQNSINSKFEQEFYARSSEFYTLSEEPFLHFHHHTITPSPQPIRRLIRTAKRSLHSTSSTATSPTFSQFSNTQFPFDDEVRSSQDSLLL